MVIDQWRAGVYLLLAAVCFAAGWNVHSWRVAYDLEAQQRAEQAAAKLVHQVSKETLDAIANIRVENTTVYRTARTEVIREPIYTECVIPEPGRLLLESARGH